MIAGRPAYVRFGALSDATSGPARVSMQAQETFSSTGPAPDALARSVTRYWKALAAPRTGSAPTVVRGRPSSSSTSSGRQAPHVPPSARVRTSQAIDAPDGVRACHQAPKATKMNDGVISAEV